MVTAKPRASKMAAKEAAEMPLPKEDTTPPVTNINLVMNIPGYRVSIGAPKKVSAKTGEDVTTHASLRGGAALAYHAVDTIQVLEFFT